MPRSAARFAVLGIGRRRDFQRCDACDPLPGTRAPVRERTHGTSVAKSWAVASATGREDFRQAGEARGARARELRRLATRWILSTDATWPFESICAVFDVDAGELRRMLLRERAGGATWS